MDPTVIKDIITRWAPKRLENGNVMLFGRASWTQSLSQPEESDDGGKAKYGFTLLFVPGYPLALVNEELMTKAKDAHGPGAPELIKSGKINWPLKDQGTQLQDDGVTLKTGYIAGAKYIDLKSAIRPKIVNRRRDICDPSIIYPGCYVLATFHAYSSTFEDKKKVKKKYLTATLDNIMFYMDGERLGGGGGTNPDDEFPLLDAEQAPGAAFNGKGAPAGGDANDPFA